jgi:hypothetical protein
MHMAIEISNRTKIIAGVGLLVAVAAAAGAWFFLFEEEPPAPAVKVAAKPPAKPAADTAKSAPDAPKPAAEAAKAAAAPAKPAAAKPIPTDPDKLIAEIIDISRVMAGLQNVGRDMAALAIAVSKLKEQAAGELDSKAIFEISGRIFEAEKMTAEVATSLKAAFNAERMTRFLELLRQPVALKMAALEAREIPPEQMAQLLEGIRKNPPPAERQKLVLTLDEITPGSETGVQIATLMAREMMDALFSGMQKAGKQVPREARQTVGSQIVAAQGSMRSNFRNMLYVTYRDASDAELAEYVKLVDTDTGRWGTQLLASAQRSAIEGRARGFAREMAQVALRQQQALAKAPAPQPAAPAPQDKPAAPAAVAPAAPAEPPGYKRAANVRDLYTRYNDLVTATVMRDRVAVKELLDDGKYPNVRQKDGATPLMIAAANGDIAIAEMLLAKGADANLRTPDGRSALAHAKARGSAELVRLLERHGAKN